MTDLHTHAPAEEWLEPLRSAGRLPEVTVLPVLTTPHERLTVDAIRDEVHKIWDLGVFTLGERIAELTARHPWVEDLAWLTFDHAEYYSTDGNAVSIGDTRYGYYKALLHEAGWGAPPPPTPKARITLDYTTTGNGNLVTCRVHAWSMGPKYPGRYYVSGPGGSITVNNNGAGWTAINYVVPAFAVDPVIEITTDLEEISGWVFHDCVVTQL